MIDCSEMSERMPEVALQRLTWTAEEHAHLGSCGECGPEWRLITAGAALDAHLSVNSERLVRQLLTRLKNGAEVIPIRRLPWRQFALGLAAAASVALVVWVPSRTAGQIVAVLPASVGPELPDLSSITEEQLDRVAVVGEAAVSVGVPGALPHLGDLTEGDLEQLSRMSESP